MAKTQQKLMVAWNDIPWNKIQRKIFKLQKRIYQAANRGEVVKAKGLQRILTTSYYAKLLAVRQVTQLNQGKKTAGVDGIKSIEPKERLNLVNNLKLSHRAKAVRRVWIPKPGKQEKRPLGIPTMRDRACQALVKMALEPYWEAIFEGTSYGFRPGRSTHDAVARIYLVINKMPNYVLDADISKCFDQIDHSYLLGKLNCQRPVKRQIKAWLKSGIMDRKVYEKAKAGTPQGGVISPLLANIALHGMINEVQNKFPKIQGKLAQTPARVIRYADDFVVLHPKLEVILECKKVIEEWLKPVGLELKPEKTRICHTLNPLVIAESELTEKPGFDFLGFNIRQYPVGVHKSGKSGGSASKLLGYKTIIKPSKKAVLAHHVALKEVIKREKTAPQAGLIKHLNPIIRGWANYYSGVAAKETFSSEDSMTWQMLRAWTVSRGGKSSKTRKYFRHGRHGNWTFCTQDGLTLWKHTDVEIKRHTLVKPDKSPYDGDWVYWARPELVTWNGTEFPGVFPLSPQGENSYEFGHFQSK